MTAYQEIWLGLIIAALCAMGSLYGGIIAKNGYDKKRELKHSLSEKLSRKNIIQKNLDLEIAENEVLISAIIKFREKGGSLPLPRFEFAQLEKLIETDIDDSRRTMIKMTIHAMKQGNEILEGFNSNRYSGKDAGFMIHNIVDIAMTVRDDFFHFKNFGKTILVTSSTLKLKDWVNLSLDEKSNKILLPMALIQTNGVDLSSGDKSPFFYIFLIDRFIGPYLAEDVTRREEFVHKYLMQLVLKKSGGYAKEGTKIDP